MALFRRSAKGPRHAGMAPFPAGLIAIGLIVIVAYFAFTKANPFADTYELSAVFESANNIQQRSPVRIAGVNVGKVVEIERLPEGRGYARVKMKLEDRALPLHKDATAKVRTRLFLEGNYFIELRPGTPQAGRLESGKTLPPNQTANPVQFGQVLAALQSDTREDLKTLLKELAAAYQGSGAKGLNNAFKYSEDAYKNSSLVNDATLGTERGDLQRVLKGQARVFGALSRDEEALKDLVTNLNTTVAAFAVQEDNLRATIPELRDVLKVGRPALRSLNTALPSLRAFARDALPAARSSSPTLDAQLPFIKQARRLVGERELKGLVAQLRNTVPALVALNKGSTRTFAQTRLLSSCQNNVLVPFATTPIPDPDFPQNSGEPFFEQSARALVALAGESRLSDANSQYFRVQGAGGPNTIVSTGETGERLFAQTMLPIDGVRPVRPDKRPVFRPDIDCETQEPPDLNAFGGPGDRSVRARPDNSTPRAKRLNAFARREFKKLQDHKARERKGLPSVDPLAFSELGERIQLKRLDLVRGDDLKLKERDR